MEQREVIAKAQLLREEITDIIRFDPEEQENFDGLRTLTKAAAWVFRHQDPERVAVFVRNVATTTWEDDKLRRAIDGAFNG